MPKRIIGGRADTAKAAWATIGGEKRYYRSRWERNYARYLEWLKQQGEIRCWKYEPKTFWFKPNKELGLKGITCGVTNYTPDFRVVEKSGDVEYREVKGWLDPKSKTKLRRMAQYFPDIKIVVIGKDSIKAVTKWARLIPGWEFPPRKGANHEPV